MNLRKTDVNSSRQNAMALCRQKMDAGKVVPQENVDRIVEAAANHQGLGLSIFKTATTQRGKSWPKAIKRATRCLKNPKRIPLPQNPLFLVTAPHRRLLLWRLVAS